MEAALNAIGELPVDEQLPKLLATLIESQKVVQDLQAKVHQLETEDHETIERNNDDLSGLSGAQLIAKFTKSYTQKANTPTMSVGMNYSKYKFSVECWQKVVDIPKKEQAMLLVNNLPDNDYYRGLKELDAKNIGLITFKC